MPAGVTAIVGPIAGASLGALATYAFTSRLQRAKPLIALQGVTVSPLHAKAGASTDVDHQLILQCDETPEVSGYLDRDAAVEEKDYVAYLVGTASDLAFSIRGRSEFEAAVQSMQNYLTAGDWRGFRRTWSNSHWALWTPLMSSYSRDGFSFPSPGPSTETIDAETHLRLGDQAVVVSMPKEPKVPFFYPDEDDEDQLAFSRRCAYAFAKGKKDDLQVLVNQLHFYTSEDRLEQLQARVEKELRKFDRVVVSGHLTNVGRMPCSVANLSRLFIKTKGMPRPQQINGGAPGPPGAYADDLSIALDLGVITSGTIDFGTPVAVPAGGMVPFLAISELRLSAMQEGDAIKRLLDAGNAYWYLGILVSRPGAPDLAPDYTADNVFADSAGLQAIPPQK